MADELAREAMALVHGRRLLHRRVLRHAPAASPATYCDNAILLYRGLLAEEPTLEDVARRLYACYRQQGDRYALEREHRQLRDVLRQFAKDPSTETQRLYDQLLAELDAESKASAASADRGPRPEPRANGRAMPVAQATPVAQAATTAAAQAAAA